MSFYAATFSVAGVNSANNVLANFKSTTTDRARVLEVGLFIEVAPTTAPVFTLNRMSAVGTGAITSVAGVPQDAADGTASCVLETAWVTTKPTITTNIFRRAQLATAIGQGIIWDFTNRPITIPVSAGLCLVQATASGSTTGTVGGYVVWDE